MKYRFTISDYDGEVHTNDFNLPNDDAAHQAASALFTDCYFVESVVVHRYDTEDTCGPMTYLETLMEDDL